MDSDCPVMRVFLRSIGVDLNEVDATRVEVSKEKPKRDGFRTLDGSTTFIAPNESIAQGWIKTGAISSW